MTDIAGIEEDGAFGTSKNPDGTSRWFIRSRERGRYTTRIINTHHRLIRAHGNLPEIFIGQQLENVFWECTHPEQWLSKVYLDVKGYSPFYDNIPSRKNKFWTHVFHETGLMVFYRGKKDCSLPWQGHSRSHGVFRASFHRIDSTVP